MLWTAAWSEGGEVSPSEAFRQGRGCPVALNREGDGPAHLSWVAHLTSFFGPRLILVVWNAATPCASRRGPGQASQHLLPQVGEHGRQQRGAAAPQSTAVQ